jgi:hypothetical protein
MPVTPSMTLTSLMTFTSLVPSSSLMSFAFLMTLTPLILFMSTEPASADELPLTLQVLNYQAFNGPDLQSYMMRAKEQIREHWHPKSNKPYTAKVFFQIFADGSLLQHEIQQTSGNKEFDDEAKAVIVSCVPYPPPPPGNVRIINVVATFGANPGAADSGGGTGAGGIAGSGGSSGYVGTPNIASGGSANGGSGSSNGVSSTSEVNSNKPVSGSEGSHAALLGSASETGMMQSSSSPAAPPRFLQGEVGAAGFAAPPMMQGQAMSNAPPMMQGQAMAMAPAPPMFQSQMSMQAPLQGGAQRPLLQADASHGAMTIGVLGCEFGLMNGQIRQILPGSDLLRYGVQPGDVIEAADGQPLRGRALQAYTRGTPGTYVQLTILHRGQIATFPIQRKDARTFSSYNGYFKKWAAQEKFW